MLPQQNPDFPAPPAEAQALSTELTHAIRARIRASGGWLSFERFMQLALYAPGLGYYSAGSTKLGPAGDFITAPELSTLFGRCIARQIEALCAQGLDHIIEIGGGSGTLATHVLLALAASDRLPRRYSLLEVSAELRERQRERIASAAPELLARVEWLDALPSQTHAIVLGNEVLDAIPTHIVRVAGGAIDELGVAVAADGECFERSYRAATGELLSSAQALALPDGYETEINLGARAFVRSLCQAISRGAVLMIDYGYASPEYYHPQRSRGTLMCHYRHRAHEDPFLFVGLQDITAHVDFTAIADAAVEYGASVLGFTTQAQFLVNCGIVEMMREVPSDDLRTYAPLAGQAQKLLSPAEMGERFKVIALGKGVSSPLLGFARGDRTHVL